MGPVRADWDNKDHQDLEESPLAWLAEFAADQQALYEDSGGEESD